MIQWTTGDNDDTPAWVGISKGDGINFDSIAGSRTPDIIRIATGTNIPEGATFNTDGIYVLRMDNGKQPTSNFSSQLKKYVTILPIWVHIK